MRSCPDDAFEWIRSGREQFPYHKDSGWKGINVSGLLPQYFEAYAKILHSIGANYENVDNPLTDRENAILKTPTCRELKSFVEALRSERRGPRIRWVELARLFGVPFQSEICHEWFRIMTREPGCWPRFLFGPGEGILSTEELSEVTPILAEVTGKQDCFFRFSEIAFIATGKPILFCGALGELTKFLADGKYQLTPEYWWPANHSWCVCSDYDLDFTFVGGSRN